MKEGIHPKYRDVVFMDVGADFAYLTRSTVHTKDTVKWKDGKEYPLYKVAISSASHPFYTGKQKFVDSAGRIEKFRKRHQFKDAATLLESMQKKKEESKKSS